MANRRALNAKTLGSIPSPAAVRLASLAHCHGCEANSLSDERSEESKGYNDLVSYFVYVLRTSSNTLYIGQTNNLEKRIKEHINKNTRSAKYIKYLDSCELVYSEEYPTRIEAMRREFQLKKWTKAKKEALIAGNLELR